MNDRLSKIYISHRLADKNIADMLRIALQDWGNGQLQIIQSSDIRNSGAKIGMTLTNEQKNAFADNHIVILIYTVSDNDWYYCMWECGLATNTHGQATRIVLFQCANDLSILHLEHMRVSPTEESVKLFIQDFHKNPTFFPGSDEAFTPEMDEETLDTRSRDLFMQLRGVCNT